MELLTCRLEDLNPGSNEKEVECLHAGSDEKDIECLDVEDRIAAFYPAGSPVQRVLSMDDAASSPLSKENPLQTLEESHLSGESC